MAVGVALAALGAHLGLGWFVPPPLSYQPTLHLPTPQPHLWRHLLSPEILLQTVAVVVPMWLVGLVNNLANIESAAMVGDHYDTKALPNHTLTPP